MPHAPLALTLPLAGVLLLLAVPAGITAYRGAAGTLVRRKGRLGLHTPATLASDAAFALANRVAAPLVGGAAFVGIVCAVLALALPVGVGGALVVGALGLVGVLGQFYAGATLGERAARSVPVPARLREGSGCGGSCGCGDGGCANAGRASAGAGQPLPDLVPDKTPSALL